jgi:hypothetical protein
LAFSIVVLAGVGADPALARARAQTQARYIEKPYEFSWSFLLPGHPAPLPNRYAPPVYAYDKFIGQDRDPTSALAVA